MQVLRFIGEKGMRYESPAFRFDRVEPKVFGVTYQVIGSSEHDIVGLLKRYPASQKDARERLSLERDALVALRGAKKHAPEFADFGTCQIESGKDLPALLTEYVIGHSLYDVVRNNALSEEGVSMVRDEKRCPLSGRRTAEVMEHVARAVVCCHESSPDKGIHRYLNPHSVMLVTRPDGTIDRAVLSDFGQPKRAGADIVKRLRTPWFFAPELFEEDRPYDGTITLRGDRWPEDVTMDVWSLGALAYYLRKGEVPCPDMDDIADTSDYPLLASEHRISLLRDLCGRSSAEDASRTDQCLDLFISICMSYDPDDRFQSAEEALDAIERIRKKPKEALSYLRKRWKDNDPQDSTDDAQEISETAAPEPTPEPPRSSQTSAGPGLARKAVDFASILLVAFFALPLGLWILAAVRSLLTIEIRPFVWILLFALSDIELGFISAERGSQPKWFVECLGSFFLGTVNGYFVSLCLLPDMWEQLVPTLVIVAASGLLALVSSLCFSLALRRTNGDHGNLPQFLAALVVSTIIAFVGAQALNATALSHTEEQSSADSWGPQDRETFTWEKPATYATFNSITNNPALGDERNFVRVGVINSDEPYTDSVELTAGLEYDVYVYYHNNAAVNLNETGEGLAQNVRLSVSCPGRLEAGHAAIVRAEISSSAKPSTIFDTAYLEARDSDITLSYVPGSAVLHNHGSANGTVLDDAALWSDEGALISYSSQYPGVIPGCNDYAGYVTFRMKAS